MKTFSWKTEHEKMETHIGNRTLFMLRGDECTHYFVERMQDIICGENANKHDLCSSTSYLVSSQLVVVVVIITGGSILYCMIVKTTVVQI